MTDFGDSALGMIETRGLVAAIEAADAMVKSSQVSIVSVEQTIAALITIHVIGETAAVQVAVDAGRAAAERVGEVLSAHVIPRPDRDVQSMILEEQGILGRPPADPDAAFRRTPRKGARGRSPEKGSTGRSPGSRSPSLRPTRESEGRKRSPRNLESMTVQQLRSLARETPGLPIQGREIARAKKETLLDLLRRSGS